MGFYGWVGIFFLSISYLFIFSFLVNYQGTHFPGLVRIDAVVVVNFDCQDLTLKPSWKKKAIFKIDALFW